MKKLVLTITCITITMFCNAQHGNATTPTGTESYGLNAGTVGSSNSFFGSAAGAESFGSYNSFFGAKAGLNNDSKFNVYIGYLSGLSSTESYENTFLGASSGEGNSTGSANVYLGYNSGAKNSEGKTNTFVGAFSGVENSGSGNVFIGYRAGYEEGGDNQLYIENSDSSKPLILGNFHKDYLTFFAQVGIGTTNYFDGAESYALSVAGKVRAESVKVYTDWADYVFEEDYVLPTLNDVENYINLNGHLKDIPSAENVEDNGIELGEMNKLLLQKIEELTLYTIEQEKRLKALENLITKKQ